MQRPIMDPTYLDPAPRSQRKFIVCAAIAGVWRAMRWAGRLLLSHPLRGRANLLDAQTHVGQALRGIGYRLLFAPILIVLVSCAWVFAKTHPHVAFVGVDRGSVDVYFQSISLTSDDGTPLRAWIVPVIDARRVLAQGDGILREKSPGIILVHDFGRSPTQMLPMISPLHKAGMVVMVLGVRGIGAEQTAGQTLGINESMDVAAAVAALRARPFVDGERIAVMGIGTGANAAMLAAARDPHIAALIVAGALATPEQAIALHIGPTHPGLGWLQRLNRWTFQAAYRVDLDEMRLDPLEKPLADRPLLTLNNAIDLTDQLAPGAVDQACNFCKRSLTVTRSGLSLSRSR